MKKYTIEYWYRGTHGTDYTEMVVDANSEEEALEKAEEKALRGYLTNSFKVTKVDDIEDNGDFKRMQELAGLK